MEAVLIFLTKKKKKRFSPAYNLEVLVSFPLTILISFRIVRIKAGQTDATCWCNIVQQLTLLHDVERSLTYMKHCLERDPTSFLLFSDVNNNVAFVFSRCSTLPNVRKLS